ncbi:MAG: hypothetical protein ACE5E6_13190, partial [Phycisphaerae bacterium]
MTLPCRGFRGTMRLVAILGGLTGHLGGRYTSCACGYAGGAGGAPEENPALLRHASQDNAWPGGPSRGVAWSLACQR